MDQAVATVHSRSAPGNATRAGPDALMIFDGVCNVCSGYVRLISKIDRKGVIKFTAIQSPYGRLLSAEHGIDPNDPTTFLFIRDGNVLEATDAMIAIAACLPTPWRWLQMLRIVPRPMRDLVYRWVARNRYKILGKRKTCMIPPKDVRDRFIDDPPSLR